MTAAAQSPVDTVAILTLWIQTAAVVVAIAASIVALAISAADRKNARRIAAADRKAGLKQQKLMFDLEMLQRLTQNLARGGHTDREKSSDMGAEALSIIGMIGQDRLPLNWEKRSPLSDDDLKPVVEDEGKPEWIRRAAEAQLAVNKVLREIDATLNRQDD